MGRPKNAQQAAAAQSNAKAQAKSETVAGEQEQPLIEHLMELRNRLLVCVIAFVVPVIPLFIFIEEIYAAMLHPFALSSIPEGAITTINTGVVSPTATPVKIIMILAIIIVIPVILHQLWRFVAPGLYKNEQRFAFPLLGSSIFLFYCGMAFAYFILVPVILGFSHYFNELLGQGWQPEVSDYVNFMVTQFLIVGAAFETPIAVLLMVKAGITDVPKLKKARAYVFLGALVLGMLLTPPDVFSQLLLALPIYALFELGILLAWLFGKPKQEHDQEPHKNDA